MMRKKSNYGLEAVDNFPSANNRKNSNFNAQSVSDFNRNNHSNENFNQSTAEIIEVEATVINNSNNVKNNSIEKSNQPNPYLAPELNNNILQEQLALYIKKGQIKFGLFCQSK
jgi:hypothetical protein